MTGVLQMLMASGAAGAVSGSATLQDQRASATALASITLASSGTITYVGSGSSGQGAWYSPPGPASTFYATNTVNSGAAPDGGSAGALAPTSGSPTWTWSQATYTGTAKTANCTLRLYSDAAGANLVATITFTVSVLRTSA